MSESSGEWDSVIMTFVFDFVIWWISFFIFTLIRPYRWDQESEMLIGETGRRFLGRKTDKNANHGGNQSVYQSNISLTMGSSLLPLGTPAMPSGTPTAPLEAVMESCDESSSTIFRSNGGRHAQSENGLRQGETKHSHEETKHSQENGVTDARVTGTAEVRQPLPSGCLLSGDPLREDSDTVVTTPKIIYAPERRKSLLAVPITPSLQELSKGVSQDTILPSDEGLQRLFGDELAPRAENVTTLADYFGENCLSKRKSRSLRAPVSSPTLGLSSGPNSSPNFFGERGKKQSIFASAVHRVMSVGYTKGSPNQNTTRSPRNPESQRSLHSPRTLFTQSFAAGSRPGRSTDQAMPLTAATKALSKSLAARKTSSSRLNEGKTRYQGNSTDELGSKLGKRVSIGGDPGNATPDLLERWIRMNPNVPTDGPNGSEWKKPESNGRAPDLRQEEATSVMQPHEPVRLKSRSTIRRKPVFSVKERQSLALAKSFRNPKDRASVRAAASHGGAFLRGGKLFKSKTPLWSIEEDAPDTALAHLAMRNYLSFEIHLIWLFGVLSVVTFVSLSFPPDSLRVVGCFFRRVPNFINI